MTITQATKDFIAKSNKSYLMNLFLWYKLPAAYWAGVRLVSVNENQAIAKVPYKRMSQNPFGSTYFACLSMAAELSTGILSLAAIQGANPSISMLVSKVNSEYLKKATEDTFFYCEDGQKVFEAVEKARKTGEAVEVCLKSVGKNAKGVEIARFEITWSFKARKS